MVKPRLGLAGGVLFKANCQGGPINPQPRKERKLQEHNPGISETRAARAEQNTRQKAESSTLYQVYRCINNIRDIINASIYLVKGGRLGLMPGVLFHSCRPSFRHTGVMFLDFASLTRLGDLWDPLDSSL